MAASYPEAREVAAIEQDVDALVEEARKLTQPAPVAPETGIRSLSQYAAENARLQNREQAFREYVFRYCVLKADAGRAKDEFERSEKARREKLEGLMEKLKELKRYLDQVQRGER